MARVSCRSRPISVLLPSSTLPAAMNRSTPLSSEADGLRSSSPSSATSEIPFFLASLHGGVGGLVVHARRAALGDRGQGGLGDDLGGSARQRLDRTGAADVAHSAKAHRKLFHPFAVPGRRDAGHGHEQAVPAYHASAVRVVD